MNIYEIPVPGEIIFDVLEDICRANKTERDTFIFTHKPDHLNSFPSEYRFGGNLGSGGKFYISDRMHSRWYVDCWSNDRTPERDRVIKLTNERLERIRQYFILANTIYKNSHLK
jgi:hypothetical protein